MKYYKLLKRISLFLVLGASGSVLILAFCIMKWSGYFSWEELPIEYVATLEYDNATQWGSDKMAPITINAEQIQRMVEGDEMLENHCFFEIRSNDDWEYVCHALGIEKDSLELDFASYYVVSINKKLKKMEYINEEWKIEGYRDYVRAETVENSYEEGTIHIYRIKEKLTFFL